MHLRAICLPHAFTSACFGEASSGLRLACTFSVNKVQHSLPSLQVEETENRPLGSRLKQMSGSLRNHSHQQPSRSGGSSPTTSEAAAPSRVGLKRQRSVQQGTGRKQAAAVPAAAQLKLSQPKAVQGASTKAKPPQSALKQSVPKVKGTPAPASSVLPTSAKQGELSLAEAKALARSIRAQRQAGVVPPASAAATAVLGNADESLAPVRKHPALPDRSMLPPKKRRAVEGAVPEAEQQPSAGSQELQAGTIASEPGSTATTRKVRLCRSLCYHITHACLS